VFQSPSRENELIALRKALKAKEEESRRLLQLAQREIETKVRSEIDGKAVQMAINRAEKEQQDAVRHAIDEVTAKLLKKHKIEIAAMREDEEKRLDIARTTAVRHMAITHQKEMAKETAAREATEAELIELRAASNDVAAARSVAAAAKANAEEAFDVRAKMEAHVNTQVRTQSVLTNTLPPTRLLCLRPRLLPLALFEVSLPR
jgi:hypothetical protein